VKECVKRLWNTLKSWRFHLWAVRVRLTSVDLPLRVLFPKVTLYGQHYISALSVRGPIGDAMGNQTLLWKSMAEFTHITMPGSVIWTDRIALSASGCCIIVGQSDRSYLCLHHWLHVTAQSVAHLSLSFSLYCFSLSSLCFPVRERRRFNSLSGPPCSPLGFILLSLNTKTVWAVCFISIKSIDHLVWAILPLTIECGAKLFVWRMEEESLGNFADGALKWVIL